ncbi:Tfp pilus assembly protein FimT/FimU [Nodularia chucula]|uniref:pilus assembly FimT family protein n=1 Tax=Nodularia chucula TaxID=3093667 RepID=UPI0039C7151C
MSTNYKREKLHLNLLHLAGKNIKISQENQQDAGFTMIEMIAVAIMIAVLAAISAPGWLGFINRQRVNKANGAILSALQQAHREAVRNKADYSVSFRNRTVNNQIITEFSVNRGATPNNWQNLTADLGLQPGKIALLTNMNGNNTNGALNPSYDFLTNNPQTITFDYLGSLPNAEFGAEDGDGETPGLKIAVVIPNNGNAASPGDMKRCVIVKTLLGSMTTESDAQCN